MDATLLGSPFGETSTIFFILSNKTRLWVRGFNIFLLRMHSSCSLKNSFSIPKVLYVLRTALIFLLATSLVAYDELQRSILEDIVNVQLGERAWSQASLPVKDGGLGIRSAMVLAPSAYLSSTCSLWNSVLQILPSRLRAVDVPFRCEALSIWSSDHDMSPPIDSAADLQKSWDRCRIDASVAALQESVPDAVL